MTTKKTSDFARTLTTLGDRFRQVTQPWTRGTEVMEIRRAVLEEAEAQIQPLGKGKYIFPYNRGKLLLLAKRPAEKAVFEASLAGEWNPEKEIIEHLAARGCPAPELSLDIEIVDKSRREFAGRRFALKFERGEVRPKVEARPVLELTVTAGNAARVAHTFAAGKRINLGRLAEVLDEHGRPRRMNDVVFSDDDSEVNLTVSREHARIEYHTASRDFWVIDERSSHGTQIFRNGKPIHVSSRDRTGIRLQDGDELSLGRARLSVKVREGGEGAQ